MSLDPLDPLFVEKQKKQNQNNSEFPHDWCFLCKKRHPGPARPKTKEQELRYEPSVDDLKG
jgi:hypothetical protein